MPGIKCFFKSLGFGRYPPAVTEYSPPKYSGLERKSPPFPRMKFIPQARSPVCSGKATGTAHETRGTGTQCMIPGTWRTETQSPGTKTQRRGLQDPCRGPGTKPPYAHPADLVQPMAALASHALQGLRQLRPTDDVADAHALAFGAIQGAQRGPFRIHQRGACLVADPIDRVPGRLRCVRQFWGKAGK